jgi:integrase
MRGYQVKRLKFRNGERTTILLRRDTGLPVHEAVLFLNRCRISGLAANTIHEIARSIAMLYWQMDVHEIDLSERFGSGQFLNPTEIARFAASMQFQISDLEFDSQQLEQAARKRVIGIEQVRMRHKASKQRRAVAVHTQATRLRSAAKFLDHLSIYVAAGLSPERRMQLEAETKRGLEVLKQHIPPVSKQPKLGARQALSEEEMRRVVEVIHPHSASNPWKSPFVRRRNYVMLRWGFASGSRRSEWLGMQCGDINATSPKVVIVRRADTLSDERVKQPNLKTSDREIELHPSVMRDLMKYINEDRYAIRAARMIPQVFVSASGNALSESSIDKLFAKVREACPFLLASLSSHVLRHTWNDQFSEVAEEMGLPEALEEVARNTQQGWAENSKMSKTYTRRYTEAKGRSVALALQKKLEDSFCEVT